MNPEHVPFFDWLGRNLGVIATVMLAIMTGTFFLARRFKEGVDRQLLDVRTEVDMELKDYRHDIKNVWLTVNAHANSIVALQTEQRNTAMQLTDIKALTRDITVKLDVLGREIADVLLTVRKNGSH